jgi:cytochrome c553
MSVKALLNAVLFSLCGTFVQAEPVPTPEGLEFCTVCHGNQLKGNSNIAAPRLSGLDANYLARQLKAFRQGMRGAHPDDENGSLMRPMSSLLSEADIAQVVKWITATESPVPAPSIIGDSEHGRQLFQSCASCHGAKAMGNVQLGAPSLVALNDWYVVNQLQHFRDGLRGEQASDTYGQMMVAASKVLSSDQDINDVVAYINTLK